MNWLFGVWCKKLVKFTWTKVQDFAFKNSTVLTVTLPFGRKLQCRKPLKCIFRALANHDIHYAKNVSSDSCTEIERRICCWYKTNLGRWVRLVRWLLNNRGIRFHMDHRTSIIPHFCLNYFKFSVPSSVHQRIKCGIKSSFAEIYKIHQKSSGVA